MDLAVETADPQFSPEITLEPKGSEIFSKGNVIMAARVAATAVIVAVPGAGLAALIVGIVHHINNKRTQKKVVGK